MSIHVLCQHGLHGHLLIHSLNQSHAGKVQVPTKHHFINVAEDEMEDLPYQKILTKSEVPDIEIEINNLAPFMYNFFTRGVIRITPEPNEVMTKYKSHFKPLFPDLYDDWQNAYPDRFTIHDFEANPIFKSPVEIHFPILPCLSVDSNMIMYVCFNGVCMGLYYVL